MRYLRFLGRSSDVGPALLGTYDLALDGRPNVPDVDVPGPRHLVHDNVADSSCASIDREREQRNAPQIADQALNALQCDRLDVEAVAEALASLPTPLRQATWLRDVEDASYTEIAATLNVPVETVLSHISSGRRTVYERLSARLDARGCTTITTPAAPQARARVADLLRRTRTRALLEES